MSTWRVVGYGSDMLVMIPCLNLSQYLDMSNGAFARGAAITQRSIRRESLEEHGQTALAKAYRTLSGSGKPSKDDIQGT